MVPHVQNSEEKYGKLEKNSKKLIASLKLKVQLHKVLDDSKMNFIVLISPEDKMIELDKKSAEFNSI